VSDIAKSYQIYDMQRSCADVNYRGFWMARGTGNFGIIKTRNFNASPNKVFRQLRKGVLRGSTQTRDLGAQRAHRNNNIQIQRNKITGWAGRGARMHIASRNLSLEKFRQCNAPPL
jgi:hypothetical protein